MKKRLLALVLVLSMVSTNYGQRLFDNYREGSNRNLTVYFTTGLNFSDFFYRKQIIEPEQNSGLTTISLELGTLYHIDISKYSFLKIGLGFGYSGFGIRYAPKFAPTADSLIPDLSSKKEKISYFLPLVKPSIAYGRYFLLGTQHVIEATVGVSLAIMYPTYSETSEAVPSIVSFTKRNVSDNFYSYTTSQYGGKKHYFLGDISLFIGYKNIGMQDDYLWNKFTIGLQIYYTAYTNNSGSINVNYIQSGSYLYGSESYRFGHAYAGLRMNYDLF